MRKYVSFMDAVKGTKITVTVNYDEPCPHCGGSGAESPSDFETCPHCGGSGVVHQQQRTIFGVMDSTAACSHCGGRGKVIRQKCHACGGNGYNRVRKDIPVNVPAGIASGQQIRVSGKGGRGANGGPNGDLYIEIVVNEDPIFKRDGNDVHLDVPLSFVDCALGCVIDVPSVYGEVTVTIPEGTQPDQVLKLKDRGIKDLRTQKPGNEYLHIKVKTPVRLSKAQKDLLKEFQRQTDKKDSVFAKWREKAGR